MIRLLTAVLLFASFHVAAEVTLTPLNNNTPADADDVMGNFNSLASELNTQEGRIDTVEGSVSDLSTLVDSQDSRITIVEQITRTFTFNGWVNLISQGNCDSEEQGSFVNCLGINALNLKCKSAFGGNYSAASLDVLGEALKHGVQITYPETSYCNLVISNYTDPTKEWWAPISPYSGTVLNRNALDEVAGECGGQLVYDVSVMCGYWD